MELNYVLTAKVDGGELNWICQECGQPIVSGQIWLRSKMWVASCFSCCDLGSAAPYAIDVTSMASHRLVTAWTAHLMTKRWINETNWGSVCYAAANA